MTIRTLEILPFSLVGTANPEVSVTISLVDGNEQRIQGLVVADGSSVIDSVTLDVHQEARTVDLYPQPDLDPVLNFGSSANQSMSYYLVDIVNRRTRYHHRFRTQVDVGDSALSWAEFANGQGPLEGGELPGWSTHIADSGIHVPAGGTTGQGLVKASDTDGDTEWFDPVTGANVGMGVGIYRDKIGAVLNFHAIGNTVTVEASLAADTVSLNVPAGIFDTFGAAASVQSNLDTHTGTVTGNPHAVTQSDVGLGNVDNTSDLDKPISTATQTALDDNPKYPPISAVTISAGAIATELDGSNYTLVLSEDVDSGWMAAIPSGGTATTRTYYATLRISPPAAGGPFALSIPANWKRFGGISTISLSSTDEPILVYLRSNGPVGIDFTAAQAS